MAAATAPRPPLLLLLLLGSALRFPLRLSGAIASEATYFADRLSRRAPADQRAGVVIMYASGVRSAPA